MTAAADRAETYLRLMAEAEVRRALAYPRWEPPQPPGLPPAAQSAVRLSRPVLAPLLPPVSAVARMSGSLLASWWPAARTAVSAARTAASTARQTPVGQAAEPVLWRALRVRQAVQPFLPGRGRARPQPAQVALDRVRQVAGTLVSAGVLGEDAAQEVLQSLMDALVLRGKLRAGTVYWLPGPGPWGAGYPWPGAATTRPLPAAPLRAIPVGTALPLGPDASPGTACLLALVMGPGRAVLTATARWPGPDAGPLRAGPGRPDPRQPGPRLQRPPPFADITATDEHGVRYSADDTARLAHGHWSVVLDLLPVPAPTTRWLDIAAPGSSRPVRLNLAGAPDPADAPPADPGESAGGLPARLCPADGPLDSLAQSWLAQAAHGHPVGESGAAGLAEAVEALQAVAGLEPGSAALSRLAALAGELGIGFPAALRPLVRPVELPEAWVSVLGNRGAADGPEQAAAVAAVLPETDGARFAVAGLDSVAVSATLHAVGWGWPPRPLPGLGQSRYSWWARDDQGRWHVGRSSGGGNRGGVVDLQVEFGPALHPGARSLDLIVRGPSAQAAVTLPLRWLASR
jgi:hypothetical protein